MEGESSSSSTTGMATKFWTQNKINLELIDDSTNSRPNVKEETILQLKEEIKIEDEHFEIYDDTKLEASCNQFQIKLEDIELKEEAIEWEWRSSETTFERMKQEPFEEVKQEEIKEGMIQVKQEETVDVKQEPIELMSSWSSEEPKLELKQEINTEKDFVGGNVYTELLTSTDQINEDLYCGAGVEGIDNWNRALLSWLRTQKIRKNVVTVKDVREIAFHLCTVMKLPPPFMPLVSKFKAEFRNEIIKEKLFKLIDVPVKSIGPKIRHCRKCDINFRTKSSLDKHMRSEHNKCKMCGKSFPRNIDLLGHIAWHNKMHKYYYFCQVCDKYLKKDKLKGHLSQHAEENVKLVVVDNHQLPKVELDSDSNNQKDQIGSVVKSDLGKSVKS